MASAFALQATQAQIVHRSSPVPTHAVVMACATRENVSAPTVILEMTARSSFKSPPHLFASEIVLAVGNA